ncbi:hypothetical protein RvY_04588 [Ramazzottius varieornatus]|uniref:Uncharacterized protein n=1 Tax=Ramazzottius varieornatus TaxID=947166 RepID=A0A1D1UYT5_RAMVA|nr:hypothetical protein RvY_04588 [Ramazzottius varieornatus]
MSGELYIKRECPSLVSRNLEPEAIFSRTKNELSKSGMDSTKMELRRHH